MAMKKSAVVTVAIALAVVVLCVGFGGWLYSIRETDEQRLAALESVKAEFGACQPEAQVPFLEKLVKEKSLRYCVSSDANTPTGFRFKRRIPTSEIADLMERSLAVRTSLDETTKELLGLADTLADDCPADRADLLRAHCVERLFKLNEPAEALPFMAKIGTAPAAAKIVRKQLATRLRAINEKGKKADIIPFLKQFAASPFFKKTDYIAQLTEEQFLRFAGDGAKVAPDVAMLKSLLAFSEELLKDPRLSKDGVVALSERRLDGFFLSNDFDGAINLLERGGLPNRSPAWQKATAAKLRAHKAMEAKDWNEANKQMLVFIDFMLSDEQKDFEECDPTTNIVYSREWVVARNYLRCADFMKDAGDAAKSATYRDLAAKYFQMALKKAKEDPASLEMLVKEMKENNFPVVLPAAEKPAQKAAVLKAAKTK